MSIGNEYSVSDIEKAILSDIGVSVTLPDTPGSFIRFDVRKRGDKAGWCLFYVNEHCVVALYGSWVSGQRYEWVNKEKKEITPEIRREVEESRKRRDREIKAEQDRVAADASALYLSLPEASDDFQYLQSKGVRNHDGLLHFNEAGDYLGSYAALPILNAEGEIRSIERMGRSASCQEVRKRAVTVSSGILRIRPFSVRDMQLEPASMKPRVFLLSSPLTAITLSRSRTPSATR